MILITWVKAFFSPKPRCFLCDSRLNGSHAEVRFNYDSDGVTETGVEKLCFTCAMYLDKRPPSRENDGKN